METDLRYPVGKVEKKGPFTNAQRHEMIASIAAAPESYRAATAGLTEAQLTIRHTAPADGRCGRQFITSPIIT